MTWNLSEAKNRLSELINRVTTEGPQLITRRDERYVVLSEAEYERLLGKKPTLKELLLNGPSLEGLDLTRDKSPMRDIDL